MRVRIVSLGDHLHSTGGRTSDALFAAARFNPSIEHVEQYPFGRLRDAESVDVCLIIVEGVTPAIAYDDLIEGARRNANFVEVWNVSDPAGTDFLPPQLERADRVFTADRSSLEHYPSRVGATHLPSATWPTGSVPDHVLRRPDIVVPDFHLGYRSEAHRRWLARLNVVWLNENLPRISTGWKGRNGLAALCSPIMDLPVAYSALYAHRRDSPFNERYQVSRSSHQKHFGILPATRWRQLSRIVRRHSSTSSVTRRRLEARL